MILSASDFSHTRTIHTPKRMRRTDGGRVVKSSQIITLITTGEMRCAKKQLKKLKIINDQNARTHAHTHIHIYIHTYIHTYIDLRKTVMAKRS